MRPAARALAAVALVGTCAVGACGADDRSAGPGPGPASSGAIPSSSGTPGSGASPTTSGSPRPGPTGPPGARDVCTALSPASVGLVLDQREVMVAPNAVGCSFQTNDPAKPFLTVQQQSITSYPQGFAGAAASVPFLLRQGRLVRLPGIARGAVIDVGRGIGGDGVEGVGLVHVGDKVVQLNFRQLDQLTRQEITHQLTGLVRLVGSSVDPSATPTH